MNYIIEKNLVPTRGQYATKYSNIPLEKLEVGDSIKLSEEFSTSCYNSIRQAIIRQVKRRELAGEFRVRKFNSTVRVWRTK